ncbi:MAG: hypothetical protein HLUCCA11_00120 [Phormidesmis priestleyi Ana]|uniref:Uncharacterized protein n=1 Tax=Phormidesmis priestleyi Ana TaxID=1666911 RepID=A0A0P8DKQ2_9CYAN|nr:MAG: hypothetical protein HLUCCA11_00120 [Phormidesmis priestleyi Ana]
MRNPTRSAAIESRFPYLCKVLYFPEQTASENAHYAPAEQFGWFLRSSTLPRVGDVIPYGQSLFSVTTVILEDCCSADAISKVDRLAGRIAEREEMPKWQAVIWVGFWGNR